MSYPAVGLCAVVSLQEVGWVGEQSGAWSSMVGDMDNTDLTEEFLLNEVIAPVVLGMFANDEWDSYGMNHDPNDARKWIVRVVANWEAVDIPLEYSEGLESVDELQQKLITELQYFIDSSELGQRRSEDWEADEHNAPRPSLWRAPRPSFSGPPECTTRLLRIRSRNLRLDRRRCRSSHRRG